MQELKDRQLWCNDAELAKVVAKAEAGGGAVAMGGTGAAPPGPRGVC